MSEIDYSGVCNQLVIENEKLRMAVLRLSQASPISKFIERVTHLIKQDPLVFALIAIVCIKVFSHFSLEDHYEG